MRDDLEGYHFRVTTDHMSLKWLHKIDNPSGRLSRLAMDFYYKYRRGALNGIADTLLRQPHENCNIRKKKDQDWYQRLFKAVTDNTAENLEHCIRNNRLYCHILYTLDFNYYVPGEKWTICVPRSDQQRALKAPKLWPVWPEITIVRKC